jgi:hypothetical protein
MNPQVRTYNSSIFVQIRSNLGILVSVEVGKWGIIFRDWLRETHKYNPYSISKCYSYDSFENLHILLSIHHKLQQHGKQRTQKQGLVWKDR